MHAAIVTEFDRPPQYRECAEPTAGPGQQVMDVVAAALHPRVRSQADGSHYTSTGVLPLVPGVDAVVRDRDGRLRYALLRGTASGSFADHVAVDERRSVPLPGGTDPLLAAAAINPVMSAWVALRRRIEFRPGSSVLVFGATGAAGRTALRTAKRLGAGEVIGAGRDQARLAALAAAGADQVLRLDQLAQAADVDVVLDYVWGEPAAAGMSDIIRHRRDRDRPLTWVAIGSVSRADSPLRCAAGRPAADRRQRHRVGARRGDRRGDPGHRRGGGGWRLRPASRAGAPRRGRGCLVAPRRRRGADRVRAGEVTTPAPPVSRRCTRRRAARRSRRRWRGCARETRAAA